METNIFILSKQKENYMQTTNNKPKLRRNDLYIPWGEVVNRQVNEAYADLC